MTLSQDQTELTSDAVISSAPGTEAQIVFTRVTKGQSRAKRKINAGLTFTQWQNT